MFIFKDTILSLFFKSMLLFGADSSVVRLMDNICFENKSLTSRVDVVNLLDLIVHQSHYCRNYKFCSFESTLRSIWIITANQPYSYDLDCTACECENTCYERGNCCPDKWLYDGQLGGQTFGDISDMERFLLGNDTELVKTVVVFNETCPTWTCVPEILLPVRNTLLSRAPLKSYLVQSSCSSNMNDKVGADWKYRWRWFGRLRPEMEQGHDFMARLPVVSTMSGKPYKTIYHLRCNEGYHDKFNLFSVVVECLRHRVLPMTGLSPEDIINSVINKTYSKCHLKISPPEVKGYFRLTCDHTFLDTCPTNNNEEKNHQDTCSKTLSPVTFTNQNGVQFDFRNIACFMCYILNGLLPEQFDIREIGYSMEPDLERRYSLSPALTRPTSVLQGHCNEGMFFNATGGRCEVIHCPRMTYMFNNTCVSALGKMHNVVARTTLTILLKGVALDLVEGMKLAQPITEETERLASLNFRRCEFGLWVDVNAECYVLVVTFLLDHDATYSDYLNSLRDFTMALSEFKIHMTDSSIPISIVFNSRYAFVIVPLTSAKVVDRMTETKLQQMKPYNYYSFSETVLLILTKLNFCFRIAVENPVFMGNTKDILKVGRYMLYSDEFEMIGDVALVCDDVFIGDKPNQNSTPRVSTFASMNGRLKNTDIFAIVILSLGVFIFIVVVLRVFWHVCIKVFH